jgi:DnaJ-class molecular chaperone
MAAAAFIAIKRHHEEFPNGVPRKEPIHHHLLVSLEMCYSGGQVPCTIKSQPRTGLGNAIGNVQKKEFVVDILPGYAPGMKVKFNRAFQGVDVTFILEDESHAVFTRPAKRPEDLIAKVHLSSAQLKADSFEVQLSLPSGRTELVRGSREECPHGSTRTLPGLGMPRLKDGKMTGEYGDLVVRFSWPAAEQCCVIC